PDQPTTTEKPPETPTTTTDALPTDDVIILFKGNQAVLERDQTGDPLQRQHLMLVFKKPEHRESGTGKPAKDDSGFDKDGVHGGLRVREQTDVRVPAGDRDLQLRKFGDAPKQYYRVGAYLRQHAGGVGRLARHAVFALNLGGPRGRMVDAEI